MQEDLEQRLKEQEAILERLFPEQVAELERLTHDDIDAIYKAIYHIAKTRSISKYAVIDILLAYHRMQ